MTITVETVEESLENNGLKILVHGPAGSGKTVLTATAGMPTILISAEGGLLSLKKVIRENPEIGKLIKIVKIKSKADLDECYDWIAGEDQLADWVMLDSISEIAEQVLSFEKKNNKDPRAAYGNLTDSMMGTLRNFRDLENYNILMTCKQIREVDQDTERTRFVPLFPGRQVGPAVPYLFDEVFALRVESEDLEGGETKEYRVLQTSRDAHYEAKDRSGELEMFENPNLYELLKKINPEYVELKNRDKEKPAKKKKKKSKAKSESKAIWVCCECDTEQSIKDEPKKCTKKKCKSTDFYSK